MDIEICMKNDACVIMFVRSPEKGTVKTRLSAGLDEQVVLELYRCFVLDLVRTLSRGPFALHICFHPPGSETQIRQWLGEGHTYSAQKGNDLGERMEAAFLEAFAQGFREVLLMGSDSPDITVELLEEALGSLKSNHAVIGPALDGGYYLVGFNAGCLLHDVFAGMDWGTAGVHERTMQVFTEHGYDVHVLPVWRDIDTCDDIRAFMREHRETPLGTLRTLDYLREHMERMT